MSDNTLSCRLIFIVRENNQNNQVDWIFFLSDKALSVIHLDYFFIKSEK